MKVAITGASNFVNRMFEACGPYQWAREFLKNSIEANATKVEFGIEWQAVERLGVYRRTIIDNGSGMNAEELREFFSTLGAGAKKIGGVHENFGVGAKIASLPWNPDGVVVISYKNGKASMISIVLDAESGDYELTEYETPDGNRCVIDPTEYDWRKNVDWGTVRPDWLKENGTVVVLLGSTEHPDTVLGNPYAGENDIKGLSVYLNTRFWDLSKTEVKVVELRSEKKNSWPVDPQDRDDARRPNNRTIMGARYYLTDVKAPNGKLRATGSVPVAEGRVNVEWYLWEGERPAVHSYAKKGGYIAARYHGELYQLTQSKLNFRWFGIVESAVQQNLALIVDAQAYLPSNGRWGVHPDQSRNRLIFTGGGDKGVELPLSDWGLEFAGQMPPEIVAAIREARGDMAGTIEDEEYRKRLQERFGNRWTMKVLVKARPKVKTTVDATVTDEDVEVLFDILEGDGEKHRVARKRRKSRVVLEKKALPGGNEKGEQRDMPVDVPRYRYAHKDEFEKPWHLALWAPTSPDGPEVVINGDSPILEEAVRYHQEQYPDMYADEVAVTVRQVFGEVAACKIAHSQKLTREISEEDLNVTYRNEAALTVALMGLMAEESLIAQRLGRLGRKKAMA
jgi:hypothetical protein